MALVLAPVMEFTVIRVCFSKTRAFQGGLILVSVPQIIYVGAASVYAGVEIKIRSLDLPSEIRAEIWSRYRVCRFTAVLLVAGQKIPSLPTANAILTSK